MAKNSREPVLVPFGPESRLSAWQDWLSATGALIGMGEDEAKVARASFLLEVTRAVGRVPTESLLEPAKASSAALEAGLITRRRKAELDLGPHAQAWQKWAEAAHPGDPPLAVKVLAAWAQAEYGKAVGWVIPSPANRQDAGERVAAVVAATPATVEQRWLRVVAGLQRMALPARPKFPTDGELLAAHSAPAAPAARDDVLQDVKALFGGKARRCPHCKRTAGAGYDLAFCSLCREQNVKADLAHQAVLAKAQAALAKATSDRDTAAAAADAAYQAALDQGPEALRFADLAQARLSAVAPADLPAALEQLAQELAAGANLDDLEAALAAPVPQGGRP